MAGLKNKRKGKVVKVRKVRMGWSRDVLVPALKGHIEARLAENRSQRWHDDRDPAESWLFVGSQEGRRLGYKAWQWDIWRKALAQTKCPHHTFHDTRHTYASVALALTRNPAFVARQLGDTVATFVKTYAHDIEDISATYEGLVSTAVLMKGGP